ncbi:LptF/LptG family permease [Mucisphaera sp.]|uniref:LptF/LptG family permease n=1 Tax=Mucisphaera sp. TaxID=2913024 RepID=UPI003D0E3BB9
MSWTLSRYILFELLKILVISSVTLVCVISFAAAIKPLADGLLGPAELLRFVGYTMPTMLGFVLPFAGAFASTLVFCRMAADNEVMACSASGIGHRAILLPVAGLGLALTMTLFMLSNFVIPGFYKQAALTIEKDLLTVLVSRLNDREPFTRGNWVVFADGAETLPPPVPEPGRPAAEKLVRLSGVAVQELTARGAIRNDHTAETATALLYRDPVSGDSVVTLRLEGFVSFSSVEGDFRDGYVSSLNLPPLRLPSVLRDNPKYFSWPELRELAEHPQRFDRVRDSSLRYLQLLAAERLRAGLIADLERGLPVRLVDPGTGQSVVLDAPDWRPLGRGVELLSRGEVLVRYRSASVEEGVGVGAVPLRPMDAERAYVAVERRSDSTADPRVTVELRGVTMRDAGLGLAGQSDRRLLPELVWPEPVLGVAIETIETDDLLSGVFAPQTEGEVAATAEAAAELRRQLRRLASRIISQLHVRGSLAVSCTLLMLLGACVGMLAYRWSTLAAYSWSFVAAIITIIIIHSGENLATRPGGGVAVGLPVLWSGVLLLAVVLAGVFVKLRRP